MSAQSLFRSAEQTRFHRLIEQSLGPGLPLLAGGEPGLGKTHAYALALLSSGKKVAIAFPTRDLIKQFLTSQALRDVLAAIAPLSPSVMEFRPRSSFEDDESFREYKAAALEADVLLITHAAALIDAHSTYVKLEERDVVLFDEADLLADAADLRSALTFTPEQLKAFGVAKLENRQALEKIAQVAIFPEDRIVAKMMIRGLDKMEKRRDWEEDRSSGLVDSSSFGPAAYCFVGRNDQGELVMRHRSPGRMLKALYRRCKRCIFVSGTLKAMGNFESFKNSIGLENIDPSSNHIAPKKHGALSVLCAREELNLHQKARCIAIAQKPVLILASSHDAAYALHGLLPGSFVRLPGEKLAEAMSKCADDGVFISAGAWSGLDDPRLRWATVVIPDTPYGVPTEVDGKYLTSFCDSAVTAIRRTRQGLYRGLREPDSVCTLLLLDPRSARPALQKAIPDRFEFEFLRKTALLEV